MRVWPQGGLWRHPDFLRLWSAQTISQFGSQISQLALPLAAILVLDASAFEVALLGTVEFLPFLLFALPAGVWVDRLRRKPILVLGDLGRAVALWARSRSRTRSTRSRSGSSTPSASSSASAPSSSTSPTSRTCPRSSSEPSSSTATRSSRSAAPAAALAGPGLAGVLIGATHGALRDPPRCRQLRRLGRSHLPHPPNRDPSRADSEAEHAPRAGGGAPLPARPSFLATARAHRRAVELLQHARVLDLPRLRGARARPFSDRSSDSSSGSETSVGCSGAVAASRLSARLGVGPTLVGSALVFGPALLLVPAAPQSQPIPFLVAALILASFAGIVFNVTGISFQQAVTPDRMLGRLNATRRFIVFGVIPLGSLTGGALASTIGLRPTLWVGAIGGSFELPAPPALTRPLDRQHGRCRAPTCTCAAGRGRCLSYPRSRPGCESSIRWSRRPRSSVPGPAHVATLKTIDPPLSALEGRRLAGAERRAKNLLFPTRGRRARPARAPDERGRIRYLKPGAKGPKRPMFRLGFSGGGELILTEGGKKKRAGVWLTTPDRLEADLAHLGPDALDVDTSSARRDPGSRAPPAPSAPPRPARTRRNRYARTRTRSSSGRG